MSLLFVIPKLKSVRESIFSLIKIFFSKPLVYIWILMTSYVISSICLLHKIGMWNFRELKNTLIWFLFFGITSMIKTTKIKEDKTFFVKSIFDYFKIFAIIGFIINYYTFNLIIELILLPLLAFVFMVLAVNKDARLKRILDNILGFIGILLVLFSLYNLIFDWKNIFQFKILANYMTLPLLTLLFLPFIYLVMVYSVYDDSFLRIETNINDPKIRLFAKLYGMLNFHLKINHIERWVYSLAYADTSSVKGIKDSIKDIKELYKKESEKEYVSAKEGWSPYVANNFLKDEGLKTGHYKSMGSEEWFAQSKMLEFGEGAFKNHITYFIDGNRDIVDKLELMLDVINVNNKEEAHDKLLYLSQILFIMATNKKLSKDICDSIIEGKSYEKNFGLYNLNVKKKIYPTKVNEWYEIKFRIKINRENND